MLTVELRHLWGYVCVIRQASQWTQPWSTCLIWCLRVSAVRKIFLMQKSIQFQASKWPLVLKYCTFCSQLKDQFNIFFSKDDFWPTLTGRLKPNKYQNTKGGKKISSALPASEKSRHLSFHVTFISHFYKRLSGCCHVSVAVLQNKEVQILLGVLLLDGGYLETEEHVKHVSAHLYIESN